jgi:hypothetical protein
VIVIAILKRERIGFILKNIINLKYHT